MSDKKTLLKTKPLKEYFHTPSGELHAVDDVNMQIVQGQTLEVVGESGCGKSMLGRTILRPSRPNSEQIFFDSKDISECGGEDVQNLHMNIQIIFQDPYASLNPHMTVNGTIGQPIMVNKIHRKKSEMEKWVTELMNMVGLTLRLCNAYPHELDGRRRQRIEIARALSLDPKFIVYDEPVSALDVSIRVQILNLLMDSRKQRGLTYIFIIYSLSMVKCISSEIMVTYLDQCIGKASSRGLFKSPLHPCTQALLGSIPVPRLQGRNGKRQNIKREIVNSINPAPGRRFAPGCPRAAEKYMDHDIPLKNISENHQVACVLLN